MVADERAAAEWLPGGGAVHQPHLPQYSTVQYSTVQCSTVPQPHLPWVLVSLHVHPAHDPGHVMCHITYYMFRASNEAIKVFSVIARSSQTLKL